MFKFDLIFDLRCLNARRLLWHCFCGIIFNMFEWALRYFTIPQNKLLSSEFSTKSWGPASVVRQDGPDTSVQFTFTGLTDSGTGLKDNYPVDTVYGQIVPSHASGDFSNFSAYALRFENLDTQAVSVSIFINTGFTGPSGIPSNDVRNDTFWQSTWTQIGLGQSKIVTLYFDYAIPWNIADNPSPHTQGINGVAASINGFDRTEISAIGFEVAGPSGNSSATILVSPACPSTEGVNSFIITDGTLFKTSDTNRPWFYAGTNNYYVGVDNASTAVVDEIISDMAAMKLNVLRLWGFNGDQSKTTKLQGPNAGDFMESNFQMLDYVLYKAGLNDIRVIIPLTNYWNDYGGMKQYVSWAGDTTPTADEFYTNTTAQSYFKNFLSYLANRTNIYNGRIYKNDPTILAWQLANEPRYRTDIVAGDGSALSDWISSISFYLKNTIGVKQFISAGMEGFYDTGNAAKGGKSWMDNEGTDFMLQHTDSNINFTGFHLYQDSWVLSDTQCITWIANHIRDARRNASLGKPVVMDEYGRNTTIEARNVSFKSYLKTANRELANGTNFWILYHDTYPNYDGFGVYYPNDINTVKIIKNYTNKIELLNKTGVHQLLSFEYDNEGFNKTSVAGAQINSITRVDTPTWSLTGDGAVKIDCLFSSGDKAMIGTELKDSITSTVGINVSDYGYKHLVARVMVENNTSFDPCDLSIKLYNKTTGGWTYACSPELNITKANTWYELAWPIASAGDLSILKEIGIDVSAGGDYAGNIYVDFIGGDLTNLPDNLVPKMFSVMLGDIDSGLTNPTGDYRWLDVNDQAYCENYRNNYNYTQATVKIDYYTNTTVLYGTLKAQNLKPNFAYQLKMAGNPDVDEIANEHIGLAGRWWQEEWNNVNLKWANGQNLNNKGNGSSPNPNDDIYFARRDILDSNSPTGKKYRYTGYLVLDYFITDEQGNAELDFQANSSYHVLWKTSQRSHSVQDGPIKTVNFDAGQPNPVGAYDVNYSEATVSIFGEWERLPVSNVKLPPGNYNEAEFILTEESFHGSGDDAYDGSWAAAMGNTANFDVIPIAADLNGDGKVNLGDLNSMSDNWLSTGLYITSDINNDTKVNFLDFAEFAHFWQVQ